ncbi:MAG: DUF2238 domain-containing protein [Gammaproteobacteria bacterium]|nr:DUF2238 domain-containing protein [Gammaproteobacteria bacterium]
MLRLTRRLSFFRHAAALRDPCRRSELFSFAVLIMAISTIFEVLEWWAAVFLSKDQGAAYLGHKEMSGTLKKTWLWPR